MSVGDVFVLDEKQGKTFNRIDTTANWELANPVLGVGEFGVEKLAGSFSGKCNLKVGDGVTPWNKLGYLVQVNAVTVCPYDVGDILITMNSTNPEQRWPGTKWEVFAPGRVLIGAGTGKDTRGESITFKAGDTSGEYKHQLTTGELASHHHTPRVSGTITDYRFPVVRNLELAATYRGMVTPSSNSKIYTIVTNTAAADSKGIDDYSAQAYTAETGSSFAHNIIQTYFSCYFYKRIS